MSHRRDADRPTVFARARLGEADQAHAVREHSLPIFTGVRVRSQDGRLSLLATDRFRLAWAIMPWET